MNLTGPFRPAFISHILTHTYEETARRHRLGATHGMAHPLDCQQMGTKPASANSSSHDAGPRSRLASDTRSKTGFSVGASSANPRWCEPRRYPGRAERLSRRQTQTSKPTKPKPTTSSNSHPRDIPKTRSLAGILKNLSCPHEFLRRGRMLSQAESVQ